MKNNRYNLPRPEFSSELVSILKREVDRQNIELDKLTIKQKRQFQEVNEEILEKSIPHRYVLKKLPSKLGSGIFLHPSEKAMQKGEVIASYSGSVSIAPQNLEDEGGSYVFSPLDKILLTREEQKKYDRKNQYHPKRYYYLKIDASKKGNFTRYINHSEQPNVVACLSHIKDNYGKETVCEVIYMCKNKILPGEQLLVSYEDGEESYWKAMGFSPKLVLPDTFKLNSKLELISTTS